MTATLTQNKLFFYFTALKHQNITPDEINYVVSTHGHSDHIGNNNLFLKAKHIVGFSVSFKEKYYTHAFDKGTQVPLFTTFVTHLVLEIKCISI